MRSPPVLLLIDWQKGFETLSGKVHRNNPEAEANVMRLLEAWREARRPVIHVRHDSIEADSPFRPGEPGNEPMSFAVERDGEPVVRKAVNSAFIGTGLAAMLNDLGRPDVVVAGVSTDHCVSTTVRMGANLGYRMRLAADACYTFTRDDPQGGAPIPAEDVHRVAIASLAGEFARIEASAVLVAAAARDRG